MLAQSLRKEREKGRTPPADCTPSRRNASAHPCCVDHSSGGHDFPDHQDRMLCALQELELMLAALDQPSDKHDAKVRQLLTSFFSSFENLNLLRFFTNHRKK